MDLWLNALLTDPAPAVLITVAGARGSTPREPGTRMVVTAHALYGTIGGGGLEHKAIATARELLAAGRECSRLERYPLGLAFGQCCGGVAFIHFHCLPAERPAWLMRLAEWQRAARPAWLARLADYEAAGTLLVGAAEVHGSLGDAELTVRVTAQLRALLAAGDDQPRLAGLDGSPDPGVGRGPALLLEPLLPDAFHIALFGAGHVGRALVRVLEGYPCRITWVDNRAEQFPVALPPQVTVRYVAEPAAVVDELPPDAFYLVMTHDHALDLEICARVLLRHDIRYCGLIGSQSKRNNFERRLKQRGLTAADLERLTCPIGIPGIRDKHPAAIAIAVAAELLQRRHATAEVEEKHDARHHSHVGASQSVRRALHVEAGSRPSS
ncbi:MAG TPA: xanthine dehydrogenase accessory protein XdhC [Candidatus Competibacteraceae bacterium]|nr:xanthine dehydrogenase accessory protein XdhC [Candidatus Competibacteraceae bacterium]